MNTIPQLVFVAATQEQLNLEQGIGVILVDLDSILLPTLFQNSLFKFMGVVDIPTNLGGKCQKIEFVYLVQSELVLRTADGNVTIQTRPVNSIECEKIVQLLYNEQKS